MEAQKYPDLPQQLQREQHQHPPAQGGQLAVRDPAELRRGVQCHRDDEESHLVPSHHSHPEHCQQQDRGHCGKCDFLQCLLGHWVSIRDPGEGEQIMHL